MALSLLGMIDRGALLDEAELFAIKHRQEAFADVRAAYAMIGFDIGAMSEEVDGLVVDGRDALAQQQAAQNRYELESRERREVVVALGGWLDKLHRAGRYAEAKKHPAGNRLPKLFFTTETDVDSWRSGHESLRKVIANLEAEPVDWPTIGLPTTFLDEGKALLAAMRDEWEDAIDAEAKRIHHTARLDQVVDEIKDRFKQIHTARELAMAVTGRELPGLELSLVKAAAASPAAARAEAPEDGATTTGL